MVANELPLILVVDDDHTAVQMLAEGLQGVGKIQFALSGSDALKRIGRHRPDLVLLDADMPGLDGFATCAAIGRLAGVQELPVIFVTARSDPESEVRALNVGAVDFIQKPISLPVVRARVQTHLTLKRRNEEVLRANQALETRVNERTQALQKANAQLHLADVVFQSTQESIVITDRDCRIIAINPAFSKVTEYPPSEVIGQHMRILQSGKHDRFFYQQMWESIQNTGCWQGEIFNRRKSGDIYKEWLGISTVRDAQGQDTHYIGVAADLSRMNRVQTDLEHLAHHDALTGLPNRLLLQSRLDHSIERAKRDNGQCAVLFLDLDRFKEVNDTFGHAAGDDLLKHVAERMKGRLRDVDTLARLGGDEFVIVLEGINSPSEAASVANQVIETLARPVLLSDSHAVQVGVSVGISFFPRDANDSAALLAMADEALYTAKREGRNTWRFATTVLNVG